MSKWGIEEQETLGKIKDLQMNGYILNIAAGDGRFNNELLKHADQLLAIDISPSELELLKESCPNELKNKLETKIVDITKPLPFKEHTFDGIFCTGTLHLYPKEVILNIINEIKRILKKDGKFILDFATDITRLDINNNLVVFPDEGQYTTFDAINLFKKAFYDTNIDIQVATFHEEGLDETVSYKMIEGKFLIISKPSFGELNKQIMDNISSIIKEKFNIDASYIEFLGEGYDSKSYVINEEYLFKFAKHDDSRNSYKREYKILNFLRDNFKSNIQIPQIEYYDESGIIGYKLIKGNPITKELYESMTEEEKEKLTTDIANFLKSLHNLDVSELKEFKTSLYDAYKADLELLREKIFSKLTEKERKYIENFIASILSNTKLFHSKMCLCHNDLSADHILIDEDKKVSGIIDFGDACIIEDYRDFMYILEESEEEVGRPFGERVLDKYAYPDKNLALEYAELNDEYYPIETIVCGIENEDEDLLAKGLNLLREKIKE